MKSDAISWQRILQHTPHGNCWKIPHLGKVQIRDTILIHWGRTLSAPVSASTLLCGSLGIRYRYPPCVKFVGGPQSKSPMAHRIPRLTIRTDTFASAMCAGKWDGSWRSWRLDLGNESIRSPKPQTDHRCCQCMSMCAFQRSKHA